MEIYLKTADSNSTTAISIPMVFEKLKDEIKRIYPSIHDGIGYTIVNKRNGSEINESNFSTSIIEGDTLIIVVAKDIKICNDKITKLKENVINTVSMYGGKGGKGCKGGKGGKKNNTSNKKTVKTSKKTKTSKRNSKKNSKT